jgi:succinate-semialdehyde dehydrogenase/glutarate-semialdehyde dehydrogenase
MYQSKNPFTQVVEKEFSTLNDKSLIKKLELSNKAFGQWKQQCFEARSKFLNKLADLLDERKEPYGRLITLEMGKPITQSIGEIEKCAWVCRYYAENGADFLKSRRMESSAQMSQINFEPLGTIFGVMPWNFPFWQVFRFIVPNIMAGNATLLKHASNVPQCAEAIETVFADAGAPNGLFQNLFISHKQVERVIASPLVKAVTFTGSNNAGSRIAALAGKYIKKSVLELGGSDPFIVFDDADLNLALEQALLAKFLNAGQSCIAAKRFLVHQDIAMDFISNFESLIENLELGNPMDKDTFIGPIVNTDALKDLHEKVLKSIKMGAICITGGERNENMSTVYKPTLLINVPEDSPVWRDEIFGPIAVVKVFETDEEAIEMANDTQFGLGASIWTQDNDKATWACKNINAGIVSVNGIVKSEPGLPFGGINGSGYGRELSDYGIFEFVNIKAVSYYTS